MPKLHLIGYNLGDRKKRAEIIDASSEDEAVRSAKAIGLSPEFVRFAEAPSRLPDLLKPLPVGEHTKRGHFEVLHQELNYRSTQAAAARFWFDASAPTDDVAFRQAVLTISKSRIIRQPISTIGWGIVVSSFFMAFLVFLFWVAAMAVGGAMWFASEATNPTTHDTSKWKGPMSR